MRPAGHKGSIIHLMNNALILHGTGGNHNSNWFPWIHRELKNLGWEVWTPDLPGADAPDIRKYNDFILGKWKFNKDSVIVGHSSGAVAILGLLQAIPKNVVINKAILVAGFTDDLGSKSLSGLFRYKFDWKKIKSKASKFILYHSDDDPYVKLDYGRKLEKSLDAELIILKNQGHFNLEKGPVYQRFPEVLEKILA